MDTANKHQALIEGKCAGKQECTAQACDSYWGTTPSCEAGDVVGLWIDYK